MSKPGPTIDASPDELRIEFPRLPTWRYVVSLIVMPLLLAGWWIIEWRSGTLGKGGAAVVGFSTVTYVFGFLFRNGRYSLIFSEQNLTIKRVSPGLRRKLYLLAEVHDLHLRRNLAGAKPKECELLFEGKSGTYILPVPLTLPEAQSIKDAIYSRFPQLAPKTPFFWQI